MYESARRKRRKRNRVAAAVAGAEGQAAGLVAAVRGGMGSVGQLARQYEEARMQLFGHVASLGAQYVYLVEEHWAGKIVRCEKHYEVTTKPILHPAKFPCVVLLCAASSSLRVAVAVLVFSGYPVRAGGQAMAVTKNELCDASGVWPARTGISAACWQGRGPVELPASFAAAETFYCCKIAHVQPLGAQSQFCVPFAVGSQSLFKLQSGNACVQL